MKRPQLLTGGLLGSLTALVLAVLSELGSAILGLPGIAFSLFDWMSRHLPGSLISIFIDTMVKMISTLRLGPTALVAKQMEQGTAILVFMGIGFVFGAILTAVPSHHLKKLNQYGTWGGMVLLIVWIMMLISLGLQTSNILVSILWLGILFTGWGWILSKLIEVLLWPRESGLPDPSRRKFLYLVGAGSFVVLVSAAGISLASKNQPIPTTGGTPDAGKAANATTTSGPAQSPAVSALDQRFPPVPGTRPELTDNQHFYRIDINTIPPSVDAAKWRLEIKGLVDHPQQLSLDQIRSRPSVSEAATLECISNELGGDLTSTTVWTGLRFKDLLAEVGIQPGAQEIYMTAVDGFYESMPVSEAMDERTLLVYEMNGQPLSKDHGYPLRVYIPNHFGMKQPKWLNSLEAIDHHASGYWVDRGWDQQAIPPTTSVIDAVDAEGYDPKTGLLPVGGIAYAGERGISKVEVQVDNGPWSAAELRNPPLGPLTWVQWRYFWKSQIGQHTFQVRAYDGTGQLQAETPAPPEPSGATGIHSVSALISQGTNSTQP